MARRRRRRGDTETEAPAVEPNREVPQPGGASIDVEQAKQCLHATSLDRLTGLHAVLVERLKELEEKPKAESVQNYPTPTTSLSGIVGYVRRAHPDDAGVLQEFEAIIADRFKTVHGD